MTTPAFDLVLDVRATLGEGAVWVERDAALWFVDIKGRALHRFDPATRAHRRIDLPEEAGCIAPSRAGGFVAGMRSGIWRLDGDGVPVERLAANPEDGAWSRFNDGGTDPAGRFVAGTMDEPKAGARAHLYRYDSRGLAVLRSGLTTANGLAFSPDGRTMYHTDTPRFTVWAYDYDLEEGSISNERPFLTFDPSAADRARPDGGAVDMEGCYWVALYEGGRVQRHAPDGRLLSVHPVPARCPTMPCFGGPDRRTLFVTSARGGRPAEELEERPASGGLFAMAVDVPGRPVAPFDPAA